MFLDVSKAHWLTMYRNRFLNEAPPVEMRVMTRDREPGVELANDMANHRTQSVKFFAKVLVAWIAMGFRTPRIEYVKGTLDAS